MMYKISAVSYFNTLPFLYGIKHCVNFSGFNLELDMPSVCAKKLIDNKVDIALIPVAAIPKIETPYLISDYCLGTENKVRTVLLLSDVELPKIKTILLDYQSRTSVNLVKILANKQWNIKPEWINATVGFEDTIAGTTAGVIIGDRAFALSDKYKHVYDLSEEWNKMTGLPFVFATWVANKPIEQKFIDAFNNALQFGAENITKSIDEFATEKQHHNIDLRNYLTKNISFRLDDSKKQAIKLFFSYLTELNLIKKEETGFLSNF